MSAITLPKLDGAASHFRLMVFGAVLRMIALTPADQQERLPFLTDYLAEAAHIAGTTTPPSDGDWINALAPLAVANPALPFARIAAAGFGLPAQLLLTSIALVEEDPNLAYLMEPDGGFPTLGGLIALWRWDKDLAQASAVRDMVLALIAAGLVEAADPQAMRNDWKLRVPGPVLDVLTGAIARIDGARFEAHAALHSPADWIAPVPDAADPVRIGALLKADPARLIVVRGPGHNGRRMLLHTAAQAAGLNLLHVAPELIADTARWQVAGAVAHLSTAMIFAALSPAPGETVTLPAHGLFSGPFAVTVPRSGSVRPAAEIPVITIELPLPQEAARTAQWKANRLGKLAPDLTAMTMTLGNIARAASGARTIAELAGRKNAVTRDDVRHAARALRDARLDALATPVDLDAAPEPLFLDALEQREFDALILRARHREAIDKAQAQGGGRGVRALFAGPSGTGKTLAARHIANHLHKDLYRIDLAATVSKYIGETEKCLDRALSAAEELDIVLLLDEGDALMAKRTDIGSSNDRYANLETNFLLQRIESFDGIILITTNDAERIDQAFSRRMDAVMAFRAPDEMMRLDILGQQLGDHSVSHRLMQDIACRCQMTGGQLRNIALHARLLAMDAGTPPGDAVVRAAVEREYRKTGDFCPLKPALAAVG